MKNDFDDIPDLNIFFRGKKYNTKKDKEQLAIIFSSDVHAKSELVTSLAMALLLNKNKIEKKLKW